MVYVLEVVSALLYLGVGNVHVGGLFCGAGCSISIGRGSVVWGSSFRVGSSILLFL